MKSRRENSWAKRRRQKPTPPTAWHKEKPTARNFWRGAWRSWTGLNGNKPRPSSPPLFDARQNIRHDFTFRLRALRAAVVETDAHRAGFHVATADDQHRVDAQL